MIEYDGSVNVEDEYIPEPIIAKGNFVGRILSTKLGYTSKESKPFCEVTCEIVDETGKLMSDEITPVNGQAVTHQIYIPIPEERNITISPAGKPYRGGSLHQVKLNMLRDAKKDLGIEKYILQDIIDVFESNVLAGTLVSISMDNPDEFGGITRSRVKKIVKLSDEKNTSELAPF